MGVAEKGLLIREHEWEKHIEDKKGTQKGNYGGAKIVENYQVTKERAEEYYAHLPGPILRFS